MKRRVSANPPSSASLRRRARNQAKADAASAVGMTELGRQADQALSAVLRLGERPPAARR